ncbi:hypothetical protein [Achromobacter sp. AGC25]
MAGSESAWRARQDGVPDRATQLAPERNYRIEIDENIMLNLVGVATSARFLERLCNATRNAISAKHSKPGITNDFS